MRVVFASDVEGTKLVGAPSCDVNSGGAGSGVDSLAAGAGAVLGTR